MALSKMQAFAAPMALRLQSASHQRVLTTTSPRCAATRANAAPHIGATPPATVAGQPLSAADKKEYSMMFIDTEKTAAANAESSFPFSPEELVDMTKLILLRNVGTEDPELLDESFVFVGPVVGPLSKNEFLKAFKSFDLKEAFPDARAGIHHMRVDPFMPNRVFFTAKFLGKVW